MYKNIDILFIDKNIKKNLDETINNSPKSNIPNNFITTFDDDNINYENLSPSMKEKILKKNFGNTTNTTNTTNISDVYNNTNFYLLDTLELIEKYNTSLQQPIKISFINKKFVEEIKNEEEKNTIIEKYIDIIKNYDKNNIIFNQVLQLKENSEHIWINQDNDKHINKICKVCNLSTITESMECNNLLICINCGHQEINLSLVNNFKINHNDSKRINICPKYSYEKISHFINTINHFQGKINNKKDDTIKDIINSVKEEIKKYKINDVKLITKNHIYIFLKDLGLTNYYNHINYIHHRITGTELNDISHLTEKLMQDFELFVQMHYKLYPDENFNYQFLLFQLLMRHKYNCSITDFNFLKTTERKVIHDSMCKEVFEELGWNYVSVF